MCWNINLFTKLTSHATWQLTDCWVSNKCQFHRPVGVECRFYSIEILACRGLVADLVLNTLGLESVLSMEKFSYKTLSFVNNEFGLVPSCSFYVMFLWEIFVVLSARTFILRQVHSINIFSQFGQFERIFHNDVLVMLMPWCRQVIRHQAIRN